MKLNKFVLGAAAAMILAACGGKPSSTPESSKPVEEASSVKSETPAPESSAQTPVSSEAPAPTSSQAPAPTSSQAPATSSSQAPATSSSAAQQDTSTPAGDGMPASYKKYVFEAEEVDLDDFEGAGYSGGAQMLGAVLTDYTGTAEASAGRWVSFMYVNGLSIWFDIVSDKAVDNVYLDLALSGEVLETVSFSDDEFLVTVNEEKVSYGDIEISGCNTNLSEPWVRAFTDYRLSTTVSLKAGTNTIELKTNNKRAMAGTMYATAPMIDCMKLYTDATLTWEEAGNFDGPYVG